MNQKHKGAFGSARRQIFKFGPATVATPRSQTKYIYIIPLIIFLIKWRHPGGAIHFLLSPAPRVKIKHEIAYKMVSFAITGLGRSLLETVIL